MPEVWLLVFLFTNGGVYASGPHDAQTCLEMLRNVTGPAACVHRDHPRQRLAEKGGNDAS